MAVRKNPPHPSAGIARQFENVDFVQPSNVQQLEQPAILGNGNSMPNAPTLQSVQPPAAPAPAEPPPAPPAKPLLSADDIGALQRRLEQAEADRRRIEEEAETRVVAAREEAAALARSQLDPEVERLRRELNERDTQLGTYRSAEEKRQLDTMFDLSGIEVENVEPAALSEITNKVLKPIVQKVMAAHTGELERMRSQIGATEKQVTDRFSAMTAEEQKAARRVVNTAIFNQHPDFIELQKSQAFQEFQNRVPPGARQTFGEAMRDAYEAGDSEFLVKQIQVFKDGKPRLTDVLEVSGTPAVATHSAEAPGAKESFTYADLDKASFEFRAGRMSRKDFNAFKAKFTQAEQENRVR